MGKRSDNPRYNVLSFRVSDDEKMIAEQLAKSKGQNVNQLLLDLLASAHKSSQQQDRLAA